MPRRTCPSRHVFQARNSSTSARQRRRPRWRRCDRRRAAPRRAPGRGRRRPARRARSAGPGGRARRPAAASAPAPAAPAGAAPTASPGASFKVCVNRAEIPAYVLRWTVAVTNAASTASLASRWRGPRVSAEAEPRQRLEVAGLERLAPGADDHATERAAAGADARQHQPAHPLGRSAAIARAIRPPNEKPRQVDRPGHAERVEQALEVARRGPAASRRSGRAASAPARAPRTRSPAAGADSGRTCLAPARTASAVMPPRITSGGAVSPSGPARRSTRTWPTHPRTGHGIEDVDELGHARSEPKAPRRGIQPARRRARRDAPGPRPGRAGGPVPACTRRAPRVSRGPVPATDADIAQARTANHRARGQARVPGAHHRRPRTPSCAASPPRSRCSSASSRASAATSPDGPPSTPPTCSPRARRRGRVAGVPRAPGPARARRRRRRLLDPLGRRARRAAAGYRVLPDGCIDVIVHLVGNPRVEVVGAMTRALVVPDGASDIVAVRFRPGAARVFFAVPADALTDARVPAGELGAARDAAARRSWRRCPTRRLACVTSRAC